MDRVHQYITTLLERLPKWELKSYDNQTNLEKIRNHISSSANINEELKNLFRVKGFSDFAMSLMWIADKVAKDPSKEESTIEEENLVFSLFRQAVGELPAQAQATITQTPEIQAPNIPDFNAMQISTPEPMLDTTSPFFQQTAPAGFGGETQGNEQERKLSQLLEKFLESVQIGSDDRMALMSDVLNECNTIMFSSAPSDYKEFCRLLKEFLKYISDNQFLDDIRVMNIISNIQDPFSQWARLDPNSRIGILDQAIEILRDFKTMFE